MNYEPQRISVLYAAPGTYVSKVPASLETSNQHLKLTLPATPPASDTIALDIAFSQISKVTLLRGVFTLWVDNKRHVITPEGPSHQDNQTSLDLLKQFQEAGVKISNNTKKLRIYWMIGVVVVILAILLTKFH